MSEMYTKLANDYDKVIKENIYNYYYDRLSLLDLIKNQKYENCLDMGCGPGAYLPDLLNQASNITALDLSKEFIHIVKERYPNVKSYVQDLNKGLTSLSLSLAQCALFDDFMYPFKKGVFMKNLLFMALLCFSQTFAMEFNSSKNLAAWHVKKTLFLFSSKESVGVNDSIVFKKVDSGDSISFLVEIPLDGFDSGEPDRDKDVQKILRGDKAPALVFQSSSLTKAELFSLKEGKLKSIAGSLTIGNKSYDISFNLIVEGDFILGTFEGTLSQFDVKPPSLLGGVISDVDDYLKLYIRIRNSDI